jgi:RNA polymerase sigma factor (sigma-70 family)
MAQRWDMKTSAQYARLVKAVVRRGRTVDDAQDLVQEAYRRLLEYRRDTWVRDEEGFLRRVVCNLAINQYHRERVLTFVSGASEELAAVSDDGPSIERLLSARQQLDEIATMLAATSQRTCEIFLAHRAGFKYAEIAQESGVSTRTVKKHIARAVSMLSHARMTGS